MLKIRLAQDDDLGDQKEIWRLCFRDSPDFIDYYYRHRYQNDETLLLWSDEKLAAMLSMIPVKLQIPKGKPLSGRMLYAIATHPRFQKRGLATRLIDYAHRYVEEMKESFTVLVPAHPALFDFYRKQGYQEGFYLKETIWKKSKKTASTGFIPLVVTEITPDLYNKRRNEFLQDKIFISYRVREIDYQKSLSQRSGGNLYALDAPGIQGCAAIEGLDASEFIIKEMLLSETLIPQALEKIAQIITAERLICRTPGTQRPFAMIRGIGKNPIKMQPEEAYLGLAFD
ncbi:MAG: GNAT family N-acetyltransferase [Dehalobacterium sp.]